MARKLETVALICANPALSSVLATTLAGDPRLRVRSFETVIALAFYARIADVDLIVADLDDGSFDHELIEASDIGLGVQVLGLANRVEPAAGVDEVIAKPMSPRYLLERVLARLNSRPQPSGPSRPQFPAGGNVVQLFRS